ncbi:MAG: polysaccharide biosynthesis C-terminal domain-containing protein, partial [Bacteroidales bacterium]|nr:polysaccharide biosynthesis C-terminal domain-containing protein [Bacteroidales bacterium]
AYEPIVFADNRDRNSPATLADGTLYFIVFTLLAFLGVMVFMPVLQHFVGAGYRVGLGVVPVVMMAEIFMGVYFNLSFWYKLTDQNWWGAIISAVAVAVMVAINVIFVPKIGYWACAWGGFAGYGIAMLLSYFIGQRKYPIHYDLKGIGLAVLSAGGAYAAHAAIVRAGAGPVVSIALGTLLIAAYCGILFLYLRRRSSIS